MQKNCTRHGKEPQCKRTNVPHWGRACKSGTTFTAAASRVSLRSPLGEGRTTYPSKTCVPSDPVPITALGAGKGIRVSDANLGPAPTAGLGAMMWIMLLEDSTGGYRSIVYKGLVRFPQT